MKQEREQGQEDHIGQLGDKAIREQREGNVMVLYLSSVTHTNLLDFIWKQEEELPIKKLVGKFSLKKFVLYDMRNFTHVSELVLDRIALEDSDEEIGEAIEEFLMMYQARITIVYEGLKAEALLFQTLLAHGVTNFVCDKEIAGIQEELRECLSEKGMTKYCNKIEKEIQQEQMENQTYTFDCTNIRIVLLSSESRMGVTTTAMSLCSWLQSVGASVCYVEENFSNHLELLAKSYGMEEEGQGWQFEQVRYQKNEPKETFHFIVYDVGSDWECKQELVEKADELLLLGGTKAYELPFTGRLQRKLYGAEAYVLCPFVAEEQREDIRQLLENEQQQVLFLEYQPEPTIIAVGNKKVFETIIKKYITGA